MEIRKVREQLRAGKSIYSLPLRVTFYARVSTDKFEQLSSLENQIQYYTELINGNSEWMFVSGYIDEGISGTSTKKRDDFNRMIADAKRGRFDFIITKEISRFSRSTLDSILYTQKLLDCNVGVFFQNDNINTFDPDSEFRLVVMAGVAQDEVRKLSERLKFGFRQSIKNGRVLGNNRIWGYHKEGCKLTVNEGEAKAVRLAFELYANEGLGIRRVAQALTDMGFTSLRGNAFNVVTTKNILMNPKYKGWYCGSKTQSIDYRSKKSIRLDEDEWVMYPDPNIPAIVSEELWDRANALYKARSAAAKSHRPVATYQSRYAYSGKIICEEHGAAYHRQVIPNASGGNEVWICKVYRQRGRAACSLPQLRTKELDELMAHLFSELMQNKTEIIHTLLAAIEGAPADHSYARDIARLEADMEQLHIKKDRLLEMNIDGIISMAEFKKRNDGFNEQLEELERKQGMLQSEQDKADATGKNMGQIQSLLERELAFTGGVNSELVTAILDRVVVKKTSTRDDIYLDIHLKIGEPQRIQLKRNGLAFRYKCSL